MNPWRSASLSCRRNVALQIPNRHDLVALDDKLLWIEALEFLHPIESYKVLLDLITTVSRSCDRYHLRRPAYKPPHIVGQKIEQRRNVTSPLDRIDLLNSIQIVVLTHHLTPLVENSGDRNLASFDDAGNHHAR